MGAMQPTHWLIVIGVLVVLFGAKKLPEAARGLGRSARILKAEVHGMHDEEAPRATTAPSAIAPSTATPPASAPSTASHTSTEAKPHSD